MSLFEPLTEKPHRPSKSISYDVVREFTLSEANYARVKDDVVERFQNVRGCARSLGKVVGVLKTTGEIDIDVHIFSDADNVFLEKV